MKKILIWLLALGGGLIALLIAAVLILPKYIDVESYLPEIEKKVTEATGRPFNLGSDFNVSVFPWAGVAFNDLKLGNPEAMGEGDFVKVKSFEVRVKIMPLLSKQIEVDKFIMDGFEVMLIKKADGTTNWTMAGEKKTESTPAETTESTEPQTEPTTPEGGGQDLALESLNIGEFAITNGIITYVDETTDMKKVVDQINFKLLDVSLERPVTMAFNANIDGKPVSLDGSVGPIGKKPGMENVNIDLAVKAFEELALKLKGQIIEPAGNMQFDMGVTIDAFSPRKLMGALGMEFPVKTKDPKALESVAVVLNVKGDPTNINVTDSQVVLDDSTLSINATLKEMEKPNVSYKLALDSINIDRYLPPPAEKTEAPAETGSAGSGSSTAGGAAQPPAGEPAAEQAKPIDYTPLRKIVLDGEITVGQLIASGAKVNNIVIKLVGKNGIFDLNPFKLDLYQGGSNVVGNFNFQQDKPQIKVDVKAQNIQVGPLLQDAVKKDVLEGAMSAATNISFTGDTPDEIKKTLNGNGDLKFLDGALVGVDLAEVGRNLKAGLGYQKPKEKPRTDFAELSVPFTLTNGLFQTNNGSLQSPLLRVGVKGTANLVTEVLNMKVKPKVVGTLKGQGDKEKRSGLAIPILVTGTFKKPEYSADLTEIASEEVIKEAIKDPKSVKKKAKELEETGKSILKGFGFGN